MHTTANLGLLKHHTIRWKLMISDREFYNFIHSASGWTRALLARCLFNQPGMATFTFPIPSVSAPFLAYISRLVLSTLVLIRLFVIGPWSAIVSIILSWSENCLCVSPHQARLQHRLLPGFREASPALLHITTPGLLYFTAQHRVLLYFTAYLRLCSASSHLRLCST